MLAVGHPADERDGRGMTALMWAARFDAVDAMTVLLDAGAGANTRDTNHRWTALFHTIHKQHPRALRLLLERGRTWRRPEATRPC